jgi:hypothetical protein
MAGRLAIWTTSNDSSKGTPNTARGGYEAMAA